MWETVVDLRKLADLAAADVDCCFDSGNFEDTLDSDWELEDILETKRNNSDSDIVAVVDERS